MVLLTQSETEDFALRASINNARNVSLILKAVHFKDVCSNGCFSFDIVCGNLKSLCYVGCSFKE